MNRSWQSRQGLPGLLGLWLRLLPMLVLAAPAAAQLQVLSGPDKTPQRVFAGKERNIVVRLHNPTATPVVADLQVRLYQVGSAIATPVGQAAWKSLQVLPGQTVLESSPLSVPGIKAETRFLIQWLDGTNKVIGTTQLLAYPPDLLKNLKPLLGDEPLGVFDPQNELKPLLKAAGVEIQDLVNVGLENYQGKLAIVGPFQSAAQMRESLANRSVKALAERGMAVVWIEPPPAKRDALKPSFCSVPAGKGAVVVVQEDLVARLAENPLAQLNLVRLAWLALHPEPITLPNLTSPP